MEKNYHRWIIMMGLICILLGLLSVEKLRMNSQGKTNNNKPSQDVVVTTSMTIAETTSKVSDLTSAEKFQSVFTSKETTTTIQKLVQEIVVQDYNGNYIKAKPEILASITEQGQPLQELGAYVLPDNPALYVSNKTDQIDIPLILQKNPQWRRLAYGSDTSGQLGENGCAIVTLAMIHSYYQDQKQSPEDILAWSGQDYYVDNEGTSWQIFYDFASSHGYEFENFGSNLDRAIEALAAGRPVIASVIPGYFTQEGHILVIRGYDGEKFYVNDPNDDPEKMHSLQGIDKQIFFDEGINYWTIYTE